MKKYINIALCAFLSALIGISCNTRAQNSETQLSKKDNETPKVYMFKEISPENLVKIYEALNRKATGKVAVKLSTGEPGGLPIWVVITSCNQLLSKTSYRR